MTRPKTLRDLDAMDEMLASTFSNDAGVRTGIKILGNKRPLEVKKKISETHIANQTGVWVVRSPGNDLLDFYDKHNDLLGKNNRAYSKIPPSVVYHYRYDHNYPEILFDKSKNYGRLAYLRDKLSKYHKTNDPTYWSQVFKTRCFWLINKKHSSHTFRSRNAALEFLSNISGNKAVHLLHETEMLFLRGKLAGWSVVFIK